MADLTVGAAIGSAAWRLLGRAPAPIAMPSLSGSGKIHAPVAVDPGDWSGMPVPALDLQWCRDGVPIAGADGPSYVPVPADDMTDLTCRVAASNVVGRIEAETPPLRITYLAPTARGLLFEEIFDQGTGPQPVDAGADFTGENLAFTVSGAGAAIDAATGLVSIPTDIPFAGEPVTVAAANSGGTATSGFLVTVEALEIEIPPALEPADCTPLQSVWRPQGQTTWFTPVLAFPGLAGEAVAAVEWTTSADPVPEAEAGPVLRQSGSGPAGGVVGEADPWQCFMRDPAKNDPLADPRVDYSVWRSGEARGLRLRYRLEAGEWSEWSAVLAVPAAHEPAVALEWRPLIKRPREYIAPGMVDRPALYAKGKYGGEGHQYMHGCAASPDGRTIIVGQDMGSLRKSTDAGETWVTPPNLGNHCIAAQSVAIDPADPDVMLALMSASSRGTAFADLNAKEGIYRSADGALTWTLVQTCPDVPFQQRYHQETIACFPVAGGAAATRKWRALVMQQVDKNTPRLAGSLRLSGDGVNWLQKPLPADFATQQLFTLAQHPADETTLYAGTGNGLWRTTDLGDSWTAPWAGTIDGQVRGLWVDPDDGGHLIVSVTGSDAAKRGVWEMRGGAWTRILDAINPAHLAVGDKDAGGRRMIWVHNFDGPAPRARTLDGVWVTPERLVPPGNEGDWAYGALSGVAQAFFLPIPGQPTACLCHGLAIFWKTEDGVTFRDANTNFWGTSYRDAGFDGDDWRKFDLCCADTGTCSTETGGDWMSESNISGPKSQASSQWGRMATVAGDANVPYRSGAGICRLPYPWPASAPAPASAGAPGRRVLTLGGVVSHFIFAQDRGSSAWTDWIENPYETGGDGKKRFFVDYDRQNPNRVYAGANVSLDGAASWGITAERIPVVGMSKQDGRRVYGKPDGTDELRFSTDGGASWALFYSCPWRIRGTVDAATIDVDWSDDRRVWIPGQQAGSVALVTGVPGNVGVRQFELRSQLAAVPPALTVTGIKVDPNNSRILYVLLDISGAENVWQGKLNADFTAIAWTDITKGAPRIAQSTRLNIHPLTSDVLLYTGNGNMVYPADAESRAAAPHWRALWNNLPLPIPNGWAA